MNDGSLSDPLLQALEARLAAATPTASIAEQQRLLYRCAFVAGRRSAARKLRRWQATVAALSIVVACMSLPLARVYPVLVQRATAPPAPSIAAPAPVPQEDAPVLRHPAAVTQDAWRIPPSDDEAFAAALAQFQQTEPRLLASALRADEPEPIELVIHPRAIETPVLKYRLFPAEAELKPGNAVPILLRLPWEQTNWMNQVFPTLQQWESRPLDAPEWATSKGVLPEGFFSEMKRAAYRREATWEYPLGETPSPYFILLPDVQALRVFLGSGLAARIRYHITRGELGEAREGILVGLANARHLAQTPFYVSQLIAVRVHRSMLDRTAELIARPNSPNLYWALSTLPDSLIESGRAASLEGDMFTLAFPAVNDLDRPRDEAQWKTMADQIIALLEELDELPKGQAKKGDGAPERTIPTQWVKAARADLPELLNASAEKVAAMSDEEAGIRWYVRERLAADQRMAAIMQLVPREAWPQLARMRDDARAMHEKAGTKASFSDPTSVYLSIWSLKRKIQALRIIEAVRDHMAAHDGKLPGSLDDIEQIPIPLDPLTDQPFEWRVFRYNAAILKAPPLPEIAAEPESAAARANMLEYWLQTVKGANDRR